MKVAIFWSLIAVWVLPFVGAAFYVNRERLLSIASPFWRAVRALVDLDAREELVFRNRVSTAKQSSEFLLSMAKKALSESLKTEQRLIEQVQDAISKQAKLIAASVETEIATTEQRAEAVLSRSAELSQKLEIQISHTNSLIAEVEIRERALRKIEDMARFEEQQKISKKLVAVYARRERTVRNYFERIEKLVEEREQQAAKQIEHRQCIEPSFVEMTAKFDEVLDKICRPFQRISALASEVNEKLVSVNPSIEHAFERLCTNFRAMRKLAESAAEEEEYLETNLATMHQRIEESSEHAKERLFKKHSEQIESVVLALKPIKLSNAQVDQGIFRVEKLICRFFVLKTLLSGVTGTASEVIAEYKALVNNLCNLMGAMFKNPNKIKSSGVQSTVSIEFNERIDALEKKVLMAFLTLAKSDLIRKDIVRTKRRIDSVSLEVAIKLSEQKLELQRWSDIAEMAERHGLPLALSIASHRSEECAKLVQHLEQCMDVLSSSYRFIDYKASSPTSQPSIHHQSE